MVLLSSIYSKETDDLFERMLLFFRERSTILSLIRSVHSFLSIYPDNGSSVTTDVVSFLNPAITCIWILSCGFSRTRLSDNGYKFSFFNREGHTIQGSGNVRLCAIIFFQFSRLQNAHKEHHPFFLINPL